VGRDSGLNRPCTPTVWTGTITPIAGASTGASLRCQEALAETVAGDGGDQQFGGEPESRPTSRTSSLSKDFSGLPMRPPFSINL